MQKLQNLILIMLKYDGVNPLQQEYIKNVANNDEKRMFVNMT